MVINLSFFCAHWHLEKIAIEITRLKIHWNGYAKRSELTKIYIGAACIVRYYKIAGEFTGSWVNMYASLRVKLNLISEKSYCKERIIDALFTRISHFPCRDRTEWRDMVTTYTSLRDRSKDNSNIAITNYNSSTFYRYTPLIAAWSAEVINPHFLMHTLTQPCLHASPSNILFLLLHSFAPTDDTHIARCC